MFRKISPYNDVLFLQIATCRIPSGVDPFTYHVIVSGGTLLSYFP